MTSDTATLLAQPGFLRFLLARMASQFAMQILAVALGWQMYELTGSAWDLGMVGLAQFLPSLLLVLPAGHLVDRHDRRLLLSATFATMAVVTGALMVATMEGWMSSTLILAVSVVIGIVRAFQMPTQQAITPQLVSPALLSRALSTNYSALQLAIIGGPALGGFIFAFSPGGTYGLCFALCLLAVMLAMRLPLAPAKRFKEPATWSTVLAGFAYIRERPVLLGAISLDLFAVLLGGAVALLPIFAKDILHTGPLGLGLLRAAPAVGALLCSFWLARRPIESRAGRTLFIAVAVYGVAILVFGVSTSVLLSLLALAISGGADMVSVVIRQTMEQIDTPDDMRGRVGAVSAVFIGASNQLGEFESGVTAAWLGPVGSVVLGGVGTLVVCGLWIRLFPSLWRRSRLSE